MQGTNARGTETAHLVQARLRKTRICGAVARHCSPRLSSFPSLHSLSHLCSLLCPCVRALHDGRTSAQVLTYTYGRVLALTMLSQMQSLMHGCCSLVLKPRAFSRAMATAAVGVVPLLPATSFFRGFVCASLCLGVSGTSCCSLLLWLYEEPSDGERFGVCVDESSPALWRLGSHADPQEREDPHSVLEHSHRVRQCCFSAHPRMHRQGRWCCCCCQRGW